MPIPSVASLARASRRSQRRVNSVQTVLDQMRGGAALHLHLDRHGPVWVLSGGREVLPDTAKVVIASPSVASAGDCLFGDMHSQTYQWVD
jgi:hypothetical protein